VIRPGDPDAHAFLTALTESIAKACDAAGPVAFRHGGLDLQAAVERSLFTALSNDAALADAVAANGRYRAADILVRSVARQLLGDDAVAAPNVLRRLRSLVHGERALVLAAATPSPAPPAVAPGGAWFLLDHAKFLPLVDPVGRALGGDGAAVIWADSTLRPAGREAEPALDELAVAAPASLRAAGRGLRGTRELLLTADRTTAALALTRPDQLVVVEGNSPYDGVAAAAARAARIPTICVQNGWSPIIHAGFRRMPYDRMCVWGEGFADLLAPFNPGLELIATGHPALEIRGDEPHAWSPPPALAGRPVAAFFLQPNSPYNRPAQLEAMLALVDAVAAAAPEAAVVVREHPGYPMGERAWPANVVTANAPGVALRDVIAAARVAVSIYSTSLIEAAAAGRPAISLNQTTLPRLSPDLEAEGAGLETRDPDAARAAIVELLRSDDRLAGFVPGMAAVRRRFFDDLRPGAAQRVAAAIASAPQPSL
jgi:hypothetical protein